VTSSLFGKRVLVVEDEPLVALLMSDLLQEAGCVVLGPAYDVATALQLLEVHSPDAAVLDINLGKNQTSAPIADKLEQTGVPFMFATGYGESALRKQDLSRPRIDKPFDKQRLWRMLGLCLESGR
jgi:CheY-like chemotaxis protein